MSATSTRAYADHARSGKTVTQGQRILWVLRELGPKSRAQLADLLESQTFLNAHPEIAGPRIPLASVCGRVKVLLDAGLVRVVSHRIDGDTGALVEVLEAVEPAPEQRRFTW